ncbi:MAG: glycosyltransferase, partial [Actinomycetes bacterium]
VMRGARPSIGVATPWVPQHTGIADYSKFTIEPLSQFCDVQVYGTWDATRVNPSLRRFDSNTAMVRRHDAFLSVLGNSHFHLPMLRLLHNAGGAVLAHDTRMLELYFGMRGPHATADLMNRSPGHRPVHAREVRSELRNLETLTDTCYWEIAQSADPLIFHSGATAHRVARETGTEPKHIGFIPYRQFAGPMTSADRREAKWALGLNETGLQVVIVGGVDFRTKRDDIIIEALGWLKQWGYDVQLHIVGDVALHGSDLRNVATDAGVSDRVHFAGRVSEQDYQRYLVAGDFGIQLRASSLLSVSGAVTDMAAFGMPGLATDSMAKEMNVPAFIEQVPLAISPLLLAEAVVRWLDGHPDFNAVEEQRRQYLHEHTRENYARALLTAMGVSL